MSGPITEFKLVINWDNIVVTISIVELLLAATSAYDLAWGLAWASGITVGGAFGEVLNYVSYF